MKLKKILPITALILSSFASMVTADEATNTVISKNLAQFDISVDNIQPTPISGIFEVQTDNGILYSNHDASYFFYGKLFAAKDKELVDLTEKSQSKINVSLFKKADVEKEFITYPAKNEKYKITVFTDTTCGYCVKLHSQMKEYNDLGISVRYLAFPRGGEKSTNLNQMSAIWCAEDKKQAMDQAKTGKFDQNDSKCLSTIRHHYQLGVQIGITGTPAIMLEDGSLISGYLPPAQLLKRLQQKG